MSTLPSTRPTRMPVSVTGPRRVPARVPTPNRAHAPKKTMPAPFLLARELFRFVDSAAQSLCDSSNRTSRVADLPRARNSASSLGPLAMGIVGDARGSRLRGAMAGARWLRPRLAPRDVRSRLHETFFRVVPRSEWKLSMRRASASSSTSSSTSAGWCESTLWCVCCRQRDCSSCCAASAAAAATFAATCESAR